jgi:ADP-dependent phosphofructokinase/glucokinase
VKTPKQYIKDFTLEGEGHTPDCICNRCKNGKEIFLTESDIARIQFDTLNWVLQITAKNNSLDFIKVGDKMVELAKQITGIK